MSSLTERQIWKTMRNLVKQNNSNIRSIFSAATLARINTEYKNSSITTMTLVKMKNMQIQSGLKEIYKEIGEELVYRDFEAKDFYHICLQDGKNWQDKLSSDDLFQLYVFQNNVLQEMQKPGTLISTSSVLRMIENAQVGKFFTGKIDFSGKPAKTPEDKVEFNVEDPKNITAVLSTMVQRAYDNYQERFGKPCEEIPKEKLENINFGPYSGQVAHTYFETMAQTQPLEEEIVADKMVGFDEQGTPVFEKPGEHGNSFFYTLVYGAFHGQLFGRDEEDRDIYLQTVSPEEEVPTDDTLKDEELEDDAQISLFKRDVAVLTKTEQSGFSLDSSQTEITFDK